MRIAAFACALVTSTVILSPSGNAKASAGNAKASPCAALGSARLSPDAAQDHPRILFGAAELEAIRAKARQPEFVPLADRLMARARALLSARPLLVSTTGRGEPDPPGHLKGLEAARRLQGRVVAHAMAFLLSGDRRYRDAAVAELDHAINQWPIWVDTAHQPPYDLMTGEISLTLGLAYDWLYDVLTPVERATLREGAERRALDPYLQSATRPKPPFWFGAHHNWNPVCNGGAAVLALSLGDDSTRSQNVVNLAAPAMKAYWDHLGADGGWDEGTGYWTYGHRYAFIAADALRRAGRQEGADYLGREGAARTGYFPLVFNPGRVLSASFGDSAHRAADPIFYFLAREYRNPDFAWFEDRAEPRLLNREGWPGEALALLWRGPQPAGTRAPVPQAVPAAVRYGSIGWAMLAPRQPDPPFFLAFKNGSLAANHTHLDLNHVSVGVGDTMLLPDLGSRPYPADYFTAPRRYAYYEISTAGHNTVLVGGKGQVPGRPGELRGPFEGPGYWAVTGVADGAYEVAAPRARRHVVFVDRRYYVLLDEIETTGPAPIELRFHTYGAVSPLPAGGFLVAQDGAALEVVPAAPALVTAKVEPAVGWTKPVNVLKFTSREPAQRLLLATALLPRVQAGEGPPAVSQALQDGTLRVRVGEDELTFRADAGGYALAGVRTASTGKAEASSGKAEASPYEKPPGKTPQLGVCLDAERFDAARAAGFDYVEIGASKVAALTDGEFEQLKQRVGGLPIPVAAANNFIPAAIKLTGPDVDRDRQAQYVANCLARLKALGVKVVVFGSGGARRVPDGFSRDEAFAQLVDFCRRVAPVAHENGITIAIEPLRRQETNIVNTAREGLALVKAVDRPEIRLLVDFYHLSEEGEDPAVLLEAGPLLAHVHVANPKGRVYPAAQEEANYAPFFANLCKAGYAGRVSVEASTKDFDTDAPKALAMLRKATACGR